MAAVGSALHGSRPYPTNWSGQEDFKISRVGSGRIGAGGFQVITDRVRSQLADLTGEV